MNNIVTFNTKNSDKTMELLTLFNASATVFWSVSEVIG